LLEFALSTQGYFAANEGYLYYLYISMHRRSEKLKRSSRFFHGSMAVIFLIAFCWTDFQVNKRPQDQSLLLHSSNPVEFVIHDAKFGAFQIQLTSKSFYLDCDAFEASISIAFKKINFTQSLFVSFIERNVFYGFISINAP
jgi:hypothetical protein